MKMLLGKKIGMSNIFSKEGRFIPVTMIQSGPNYITQVRKEDKDGYSALQIGFEESRKANKPQEMQLKKSRIPKLRNIKEVRISGENTEKYKSGNVISLDTFKEGEKINVVGTSKGKGFAGVIKRHGFHRGPESHGSDHHREPGSIGGAYPQRVFKGQKLPGRMGHDRVTVKNLKIEKIDHENNLIFIYGAVPGPNKSLVMIMGQGDFVLTENIKDNKPVKETEKSVELKSGEVTEKEPLKASEEKGEGEKKWNLLKFLT